MSQKRILEHMPVHLRKMFQEVPDRIFNHIQEIHLRVDKPIIVSTGDKEYGIGINGLINDLKGSYLVRREDIESMMKLLSGFSFYALDEEIKQGFLTIEGGHRIGIVGKVVVEDERIKTMRHISALNIRLAHEIIGCSNQVLPYLLKQGRVQHTLIVSPPKCGKTTLLRDIIRQLSDGYSGYGPYTVGVVDERSEIAGCYKGVPQNDVGIRTDVLDGCTKVEGMKMLLRAMAPDVIAVDEVSSEKDMRAVEEVLGAGVSILCTTHGIDLGDCMKKPIMRQMLETQLFERMIVLSNQKGPCTIEEIIDLTQRKVGME